jgi:hypothetical protein
MRCPLCVLLTHAPPSVPVGSTSVYLPGCLRVPARSSATCPACVAATCCAARTTTAATRVRSGVESTRGGVGARENELSERDAGGMGVFSSRSTTPQCYALFFGGGKIDIWHAWSHLSGLLNVETLTDRGRNGLEGKEVWHIGVSQLFSHTQIWGNFLNDIQVKDSNHR